jgi:hypothetical protein
MNEKKMKKFLKFLRFFWIGSPEAASFVFRSLETSDSEVDEIKYISIFGY